MKFWSVPMRTPPSPYVSARRASSTSSIPCIRPTGHRATHVEQARLLLWVHTDVVTAERSGQLTAGGRKREFGALVEGGSETLRTELFGQVAHAGQAAVLPVPQLAEELGDPSAELDGLIGLE